MERLPVLQLPDQDLPVSCSGFGWFAFLDPSDFDKSKPPSLKKGKETQPLTIVRTPGVAVSELQFFLVYF